MESIASLIRMLIDSSWRLGIPMAIAGAAIVLLHRFSLPEQGVLTSYLGWATLGIAAGASFTIVSIVAGIINAIKRARHRRRAGAREMEELRANISSLSPREFELLCEILQSGVTRLKIHILSDAHSLLDKGVLYRVDHSLTEPMCEIPAPLREHKNAILSGLPKAQRLQAERSGANY
ncbi:hypothetical protein JQ561_31400 [Bradyrhizobium diazoefficiens]|uniref:hypothetical protein n=1 Tax=Bradyrhizobium sp. WYCCWR 12699 TaxID=3064203 RepID=UPI001BAC6C4F|nr:MULTISPECIES: hypothetical protein [Bradyrhizobium]MBR0931139.1 hypothetical protein [Bradyrhizobium diazoefficiens]MDT4738122.1 hypothetical protein [Bradyrhizobium sp. WYCCWR 12699]